MARYAANTSVRVEQSRAEVEGILRRYGAEGFRYGWTDRGGERIEQIEFAASDRVVRFILPMPSKDAAEFAVTPHRRHRRTDKARYEAWEQACRQRWRALALCIKAKLEAVEVGISEFEEEFLSHIVDPQTGQTMGETIRPQLAQRYAGIGGQIRLPGLPAPGEV
ncbi:MAG: hypothetical protein WD066_18865 [Planctomycetaceae bacterium]